MNFSNFVKGQDTTFAPVGAKWYYTYSDNNHKGYVKILSLKDTVLEGRNCNKLSKRRYMPTDTVFLGYEFVYSDSNIVYYHRFNDFHQLYNFNQKSGEGWNVAGRSTASDCDSLSKVNVISNGYKKINNDTLKYIIVGSPDTADWRFEKDTIYQRIGSMGYMFPVQYCIAGPQEGGWLNCYIDSSWGEFKKGIYDSCDHVNVVDYIDEYNQEKDLHVYPNPTNSSLTIKNKDFNTTYNDCKVIITDVKGDKYYEGSLKNSHNIDVNKWNAGVYFITILKKKEITNVTKILIR